MPPKAFSNLDDAEAESFFEVFVARAPGRLEEFKREVAARGGPTETALDGSPESLVGVWRWFVEHAGDGGGALPAWYEPDPPEFATERLSAEMLHDADGLAHYLAQVFQREMPELEWGLGKLPKRMRYVSQNKPVLKDDEGDVDVLAVAYNKAMRVRNGEERAPDALLRTFSAWFDPTAAM